MFKHELSNVDWSHVYDAIANNQDTNNCYSLFIDTFAQLFEKNFSIKTFKSPKANSPRNCWITKGLIKSCKRKSILYKKFKQNPNEANESIYIAYRNKLTTLLRKAEARYYSNQLNSFAGDLRQTWKLLNNILNKSNGISFIEAFTSDDGSVVTDQSQIVQHFNDYFVNIGNKLAGCISEALNDFKTHLRDSYIDSFVMHSTDPNEVIRIVYGFSNKCSYGADFIPVSIMKDCIVQIAEVLSHIINSSFSSGIFPNELKIAKVYPIFKSGSKNLFSNYRPISVLPSFSKIFEKIADNRLESYVKSKNIIKNNQYGFRSNH